MEGLIFGILRYINQKNSINIQDSMLTYKFLILHISKEKNE